jgi:ArsR family transcriptional regulator, arsenate/arsenite/antimonite-responsive transcriptional repressor
MTTRNRRTQSNSLSDQQFRAIAKALSDPRRYEILQIIAGKKDCTCVELREACPISAATLSHHLKELESAGLITIGREGKFAFPVFQREVWKSYLAKLSDL